MYEICEQYDNNNNNGNGNSNINNNNNNNNNNTISYFVQTIRNGPIFLCQHHVNNSFDQTFDGLPMSFYITAECTVNFFFTPTRLDVQINYRKPFSYVTSVEPAIFINSFRGLCRILKVAFKNVWSFHANLNIENVVWL